MQKKWIITLTVLLTLLVSYMLYCYCVGYKVTAVSKVWEDIKKEIVFKGYYKSPFLIQGTEKNGKYREFYRPGVLKRIVSRKNGALEGYVVEYFESGALKSIAFYRHGKLEGVKKIYYELGNLMLEEHYQQGIPEGKFRQYDVFGRLLYEADYYKGVMHGLFKEYYEGGALKMEQEYDKNVQNGLVKVYYETGEVLRVERYVHGIQSGIVREFYKNKKPKHFWYAVDNVPEGKSIEYDEDGRLKTVGWYVSGKKNGQYKIYHYGSISKIDYFDHGQWLKREHYTMDGRLEFTQTNKSRY